MNGYEKAMMDIVKPIMNYLEKNFPTEHFVTCMSHNTNSSDISTTVTVKEEKEGRPETDICSITDSIIHGLNYKSDDCKLLSYNKLMELVQSAGIDDDTLNDTLFSMKLSGNMSNHLHTNHSH
jgi:hypothetical protein